MHFIYREPDGNEIDAENAGLIKTVLEQPAQHWEIGCGDSGVWLGDDVMIFFKTPKGVFIQHLHSSSSPLINKNDSTKKTIVHYVGGEPMNIPEACLSDEEAAYYILGHFVITGTLHPSMEWVDIFDQMEIKE